MVGAVTRLSNRLCIINKAPIWCFISFLLIQTSCTNWPRKEFKTNGILEQYATSIDRSGKKIISRSYIALPCYSVKCEKFDVTVNSDDTVILSHNNFPINFTFKVSDTLKEELTEQNISAENLEIWNLLLSDLNDKLLDLYISNPVKINANIWFLSKKEQIVYDSEYKHENQLEYQAYFQVTPAELLNYSNPSVLKIIHVLTILAHELSHLLNGYDRLMSSNKKVPIVDNEAEAKIVEIYVYFSLMHLLFVEKNIKGSVKLNPILRQYCEPSRIQASNRQRITKTLSGRGLNEYKIGYELGLLAIINEIKTCEINSSNISEVYQTVKKNLRNVLELNFD